MIFSGYPVIVIPGQDVIHTFSQEFTGLSGMAKKYDLNESTETHNNVQRKFARNLISNDFSDLDSNASVLEVGPGNGAFAQECLARGFKYCAIEDSAVLRDKLSQQGITVKEGRVPPIPADSMKFDLFFAGMVMEHMPDHVAATTFSEEIFRVLKPGGRACLLFPNAYACSKLLWEMDYTHGYFATPRQVEHMFRQAGFTVIRSDRVIGWFWVRSTPLHHLLRMSMLLIMPVLNTHIVDSLFSLMGLGGPLWKIRKTFFESALIVFEKPDQP